MNYSVIEEERIQIVIKKSLRNFKLRSTIECSSANFPTVYRITCSFSDYHFEVVLKMKSKLIVESFEIKVVNSEEKTIFDTIYACCEENDGEFIAIMSRYLGDAYLAKAFKRHIEYKISSNTGRKIKWRT